MIAKSKEQAEIEGKILEWIIKESQYETKQVNIDTDLSDGTVLDSIQLITLVLFIEDLLGEIIPEEKVSTEYFQSVRKIYENFFYQQ